MIIKLHYSESLVRSAVKAFWFRVMGWRFFAALLLVLLPLAYQLSIGDRSWFVGVLGSTLAIGVLFAVALYCVHYRASFTRFRRMRSPEATLDAGEDRVRLSSDAGNSELAWSTIIEVWRFPQFWLLFLSRAQFITVPTDDLDANARDFITGKVTAHGGKIA